ncbi:MAG: zf-HC2 domain-containing protein [Gemmatimonadales bacterium]|nr:zf-HC2 domain-containing protein [Gemmatimonadales bacterium]
MEPMLDCDAVMRQLWDYLDGELSEERRTAIAGHLKMCNHCFPAFEFEAAFLKALATARQDGPDAGALRERVLEALRREGVPAIPPEGATG